ncbi:MAG: hypothetical protein ACE5KV_08935 [Thermoplasmata archaeon]
MKKGRKKKGTGRELPDSLELELKTATVETRRRPRVESSSGRQTVRIKEAIVTVVDPGSRSSLSRGACFRIRSRRILADRISSKERKYRSTQGHHRFLLVAYGARFIGKAEGVDVDGNWRAR